MKLEWLEKEVPLSALNEYAHNPRTITKKAFDRLVESIKQDGYHARIVVDTNDNIIAGHSRKKALQASGWSETDCVKVLYPTRSLTEEEFKRVNIRDNLDFGDFDLDILANNFDIDFLKDIGMEMTFSTAPDLDLEPAMLDDYEGEKLCKKCPYNEAKT